MAPRTLTQRANNRAVLARQLLLERAAAPIPQALERIGGLQTQYAPSGYVGLWSRVADLDRDRYTEALERRRIVQATLMRSTIHTVSRRDYPLLAAGVRRARRTWWSKATGSTKTAAEMRILARRTAALLADGPRRTTELIRELGIDAGTWNGVGLWIDLVRVPPSGTWERRRADLVTTADRWLSPSTASEQDGIDLLVRRYLGAFGPAPRRDVANWAGLPVATVTAAAARMPLRRFRDEHGGELLDLRGAPLPDAGTPVPVRFLPTWDAVLLAHARRSQILPEAYRPLVFNTKTPQSAPTFLVDGHVAGTWRFDAGAVRCRPFEPLSTRDRRAVDEEAARLSDFHR
jgi:winged helix DNA-binding protein